MRTEPNFLMKSQKEQRHNPGHKSSDMTKKAKQARIEHDDDYVPFDPSTLLDDSHLIFSGDDVDMELGAEGRDDLFGKGFVSLEEIDMMDLNDVLNCKTTKKTLTGSKKTGKRASNSWWVEDVTGAAQAARIPEEKEEVTPTFDEKVMKEWRTLNLPPQILATLCSQNFTKPTEIQRLALDKLQAEPGIDILGSAPTGSGKTLAFGIPICRHLLESESSFSLVLVPTRELALQIRDHLQALLRHSKFQKTVQAVVGGMAKEKQERLLLHAPKVLIATPGRLQELVDEDIAYGEGTLTSALKRLNILVLDEADRLLEAGHFKDLDKILSIIKKEQTFLFSATLANGVDRKEQKSKLNNLKRKLAMQHVAYINVNSSGNTGGSKPCSTVASTLEVSQIPAVDRDFAIFALLLNSPEKTLVFVNSITMLKRLAPLLSLLHIPCVAVHAQMQQRARLKALERFTKGSVNVMIATDVVGRGIDLPQVDTVLHFQVPLSRDLFIHRSGRAGRAGRTGKCILIITPEDGKQASKLFADKLPAIYEPFKWSLMHDCKHVVIAARKLDELMHRQRKTSKEKSWLSKAAEDLGVELSEESNADDEEGTHKTRMYNDSIKREKKRLDVGLQDLTLCYHK